MSFRASHWAVHEVRGLRPVERIVLLVLSEYADDRDCAWPSQDRLADDVETSVSTLRRCLSRLEALGLLTREQRWVTDERGDTHRASNVYRLHVGALPDWRALDDRGGSDEAPRRRPGAMRGGAARAASGGAGSRKADRVDAGQGMPVNLTSMDPLGTKDLVGNSSDDRLFVGSTDTGQSDRYAGATRPYRSKQGGIPVTQVTGITTPKHQENHQTKPDQVTPPSPVTGERSGPVGAGDGSGAPGRGAGAPPPTVPGAPAVSESGRLLVAECLPEHLRALDAAGARRVVDLLEERVAAGWSPAQIRSVMDQPLPPRVGRLASLVARRLELNVDPALAPLAGADRQRLGERERQERARRRSEELAVVPARGGGDADPVFVGALGRARDELGAGATMLDVARRAAQIAGAGSGVERCDARPPAEAVMVSAAWVASRSAEVGA